MCPFFGDEKFLLILERVPALRSSVLTKGLNCVLNLLRILRSLFDHTTVYGHLLLNLLVGILISFQSKMCLHLFPFALFDLLLCFPQLVRKDVLVGPRVKIFLTYDIFPLFSFFRGMRQCSVEALLATRRHWIRQSWSLILAIWPKAKRSGSLVVHARLLFSLVKVRCLGCGSRRFRKKGVIRVVKSFCNGQVFGGRFKLVNRFQKLVILNLSIHVLCNNECLLARNSTFAKLFRFFLCRLKLPAFYWILKQFPILTHIIRVSILTNVFS